MFFCCRNLKSLPDISNWDTNKVIDMNHMFATCETIKSLPNISKWKTNKVNNMTWMFSGCESLLSLPDISKWDISNMKFGGMEHIFYDCIKLSSLPKFYKDKDK